MKPYQDQTFYELLEVPTGAASDVIREAFERAQSLYDPESVAIYSLVEPSEADALRARLKEAAGTLLDPSARDRYDRELGLPVRIRETTDRGQGAPMASDSTHPDVSVAYTASEEARPVAVKPPDPEPSVSVSPDALVSTKPAPVVPSERAPEAPREAAPPVPATRPEPPRPKPMEVPPDAEFNGELLRRVRESRGLTLERLAEKTRIGRAHLQNVEADRYDALPTTVYLRGILSNLAREIGLDPVRVSKSYLGLVSARRKSS